MKALLAAAHRTVPKPILFALYGTIGGLVGAICLGEPLWGLCRPPVASAPPRPPAIIIGVSKRVQVYPGGTNRCCVKIARQRCAGAVSVLLKGLPDGVSALPLSIDATRTEGEIVVTASDSVRPGSATVAVVAAGDADDGPFEVSSETKVCVLEMELPPKRLRMSLSPRVEIYQGSSSGFQVRIARDGFSAPVTLDVQQLPEGADVAPRVVGEADTVTNLLIDAGDEAPEGTFAARVKGQVKELGLEATENFEIVIRRPDSPAVDILFVVDVTGSMQFAITGIRDGLKEFVERLSRNRIDSRVGLIAFRDRLAGEEPELLSFDGESFTKDVELFVDQMQHLKADGGGDNPESALDALWLASQQHFRVGAVKTLLLVTDAEPQIPDMRMRSLDMLAGVLRDAKIDHLHVVCRRDEMRTYAAIQGAVPEGKFFDIETAIARSTVFAEEVMPRIGTAIVEATPAAAAATLAATADAVPLPPPAEVASQPLAIEVPDAPVIRGVQSQQSFDRSSSGRLLFATGIWTAAFTGVICFMIVASQYFHLRQEGLPVADVARSIAGGLAAGFVGGAVGQLPLLFLADAPPVVTQFSQFLGWTMLGALAGSGMSLFIPNLRFDKGLLGGTAGGAIGGLGYLATVAAVQSTGGGDLAGRVLGAALVGCFIGLLVALTELVFRQAWLEVHYGARESRSVTLGVEPVSLGSDARRCTVYAPGAPQVAYTYCFRDGKVMRSTVATGQTEEVPMGSRHAVGSVQVSVHGGRAGAVAPAPGPVAKPPPPPRPPAPVVRKPPPPPRPPSPPPRQS
jgi:hypothetical protein